MCFLIYSLVLTDISLFYIFQELFLIIVFLVFEFWHLNDLNRSKSLGRVYILSILLSKISRQSSQSTFFTTYNFGTEFTTKKLTGCPAYIFPYVTMIDFWTKNLNINYNRWAQIAYIKRASPISDKKN